MKHLLIVDDEIGSRESLRTIFEKQYHLSLASSAAEGTHKLSEESVDLVLLDVLMPNKDGLTFLKEIQNLYPEVPVIMVSASTSVQPVVKAIQQGAYDYVTKPFDVETIRNTVARALQSSSLQRQVQVLKGEISQEYPIDGIIGQSPDFKHALADARKAADSDATVLIIGESGTGKELVARSVHAWSNRSEDPFVAVHCASLPEALLESELFGYEKGAFTGAGEQKPGRFDLAGSGTIFFDEVSEMSIATQVKLLRVLQEKEFMRVGGTKVIRTNARVIAATNKNLKEEVAANRFREDLYYRLSVVPVLLPPLRGRREDIALLARYFFDIERKNLNAATTEIAPETIQKLVDYSWPGNVRELKNVIERMVVLHRRSQVLTPGHLPEEFGPEAETHQPLPEGIKLADAVNAYEKRIIEQALSKAGGVQTRAAEALGTTRRILKYRIEKLGIHCNGQTLRKGIDLPSGAGDNTV